MKTLTLSIAGMTCSNCATTVKKAIFTLSGIVSAEVDIVQNTASITFDAEKTDEQQIIHTIDTTWYRAYRKRSHSEDVRMWKLRSIWGIFLSIPLAVMMLLELLGIHSTFFLMYGVVVSFVVATIVQIFLGTYFYAGAWKALKMKTANMNTLIAVGSGVTYLYSVWHMVSELVHTGNMLSLSMEGIFFEVGVFLVVFISIGKWLEHIAKLQSSASMQQLEKLRPQTAFVQQGKHFIEMPTDDIHLGDIIRTRKNESVPLDGEILDNSTTLDESMLTGESLPVEKKKGDIVFAGTLNTGQTIFVKVTKTASETLLGKIIESVQSAYTKKSDIEQFADKIAGKIIPIVLLLSLATFLVWYFVLGAEFSASMLFACSVVVIACPCALGLATPTAVTVWIGLASKSWILVKWGVFLEKLAGIRHIFFDKTGTLTTGKFQISDIQFPENEVFLMRIACSLESHSTHPIAGAFAQYTQKHSLTLLDMEAVNILESEGISGIYEGKKYTLANTKAMKKYGFSEMDDFQDSGVLSLFLADDTGILGHIELTDSLRPGSREIVQYFQKNGVAVHMISGDKRDIVERVARELGIEQKNVHAEVFPQEKAKIVSEYTKVAMVGDGVNDSVAFSSVDVGISMGKGNDVALSTSDVILLKNSLADLQKIHMISEDTQRKIHENLLFSLLYNTIGIPIAMGIFAPLAITPQFAGLAMVLSSVGVLTNTLTLKFGKYWSRVSFLALILFFTLLFGIFIF